MEISQQHYTSLKRYHDARTAVGMVPALAAGERAVTIKCRQQSFATPAAVIVAWLGANPEVGHGDAIMERFRSIICPDFTPHDLPVRAWQGQYDVAHCRVFLKAPREYVPISLTVILLLAVWACCVTDFLFYASALYFIFVTPDVSELISLLPDTRVDCWVNTKSSLLACYWHDTAMDIVGRLADYLDDPLADELPFTDRELIVVSCFKDHTHCLKYSYDTFYHLRWWGVFFLIAAMSYKFILFTRTYRWVRHGHDYALTPRRETWFEFVCRVFGAEQGPYDLYCAKHGYDSYVDVPISLVQRETLLTEFSLWQVTDPGSGTIHRGVVNHTLLQHEPMHRRELIAWYVVQEVSIDRMSRLTLFGRITGRDDAVSWDF